MKLFVIEIDPFPCNNINSLNLSKPSLDSFPAMMLESMRDVLFASGLCTIRRPPLPSPELPDIVLLLMDSDVALTERIPPGESSLSLSVLETFPEMVEFTILELPPSMRIPPGPMLEILLDTVELIIFRTVVREEIPPPVEDA